MDVLVDSGWDGLNRFGLMVHGCFVLVRRKQVQIVFGMTHIMYQKDEKLGHVDRCHGLIMQHGFNLQAK